MYIADLSQQTYHGCSGPDLCSIGWLDGTHLYPMGMVPFQFLAALRLHVRTAWQPLFYMGPHECELCLREMHNGYMASSNLWRPGPALLYIAPGMIVHYIQAHHYRPPDEFIEAVLNCPPQGSPAFMQAMQPYLHYWDIAELHKGSPPAV